MTEQSDNAARLIQLAAAQMDPNAEVDAEKLMDVLGFNSMQQLAFLTAVNEEFGVNITPEEAEAARGKGGLLSLLNRD